jgi:hypothetical protein
MNEYIPQLEIALESINQHPQIYQQLEYLQKLFIFIIIGRELLRFHKNHTEGFIPWAALIYFTMDVTMNDLLKLASVESEKKLRLLDRALTAYAHIASIVGLAILIRNKEELYQGAGLVALGALVFMSTAGIPLAVFAGGAAAVVGTAMILKNNPVNVFHTTKVVYPDKWANMVVTYSVCH